MRRYLALTSAMASVLWTHAALAQRAGDNAAAAADDAFGTTVGNESIGLYDAYDARGFSPAQAGNVRIEGLYFDQQSQPNNRVSNGNTVRVGISAQAYAFPAPTGIADYTLRLPGDKFITSTFIGLGQYNTADVEVDTQIPVITDKLSIGFGGQYALYDNDVNARNVGYSAGFLARWRAENAETSVFWGRDGGNCCRQEPVVFTSGPFLPPKLPLHYFWGQRWTGHHFYNEDFGAITKTNLMDGWTFRAGLFRSNSTNDGQFGDFLTNVQPNGAGDHTIVAQPSQLFGSWSGEMRATNVITDGDFRHTINIAIRGRDVERWFGGADVRNFGTAYVGVRAPLPEPVFNFGPMTHDHARQGTGGIAYDGLWAGVAEFGLGIQKTVYHREIAQPGFALAKSSSSPWLYNATLSVFATKDLAFYGSYTKGLEESGTAPPSAANRGEAMPASLTTQFDAGFRYTLMPGLKFVAGVFQVEKPYYNINAANVFGPLGTVRHRGVELSLAGNLFEGLSVVGGTVLLQPRISGDPVTRGLVGRIPPGPRPTNGFVSLTYQPPSWGGFSVDTQVYYNSPKTAHSDNLLDAQGFTEANLGARYNFTLKGVPASVRAQASNIFNHYALDSNGNGSFYARAQRRYLINFTADF